MQVPLREPAVLPVQPEAPPPPEPRKHGTIGFATLILVGAGLWMGWNHLQEQQRAVSRPVARTATAKVGDIQVLARISGTTSARNFANVVAPLLRGPESDRAMSLIAIAEAGKIVKKGDLVAEFDSTNIRDHLDDTRAGLEERVNAVKKLRVQQELELANLDQRIRVARSTLDKARLDMKTREVRSAIMAERFALAAEEAAATLKMLQAERKMKVEAQQAELNIALLRQKMEEAHVERHVVDVSRMKVLAPIGGMVIVMAKDDRGGERKTFVAGDLITPGTPIVRIVDPARLQIEGTINQTESNKFRLGQRAEIGFDAYPANKYKGEVTAIGALASLNGRQQYYIRSIPLRVTIETAGEHIIPDLTGYANILIDEVEDVVTVPQAAVDQDKNGAFVEVRNGEGFVRKPVQLGLSDGVNVAVLEGLQEGEVVRLAAN